MSTSCENARWGNHAKMMLIMLTNKKYIRKKTSQQTTYHTHKRKSKYGKS